jgi:hypothetical protein
MHILPILPSRLLSFGLFFQWAVPSHVRKEPVFRTLERRHWDMSKLRFFLLDLHWAGRI